MEEVVSHQSETFTVVWDGVRERTGAVPSLLGVRAEKRVVDPLVYPTPRQIDRLPRTRAQIRAGLTHGQRRKLTTV